MRAYGGDVPFIGVDRNAPIDIQTDANGSRCSDKTSRLHPRHVVPKLAQAYEPEVPVEMREWIGRTLASPDLAFDAQPPAQPHGGVIVDRSIGFANTADAEVALASA
jgi:hypothetical protein